MKNFINASQILIKVFKTGCRAFDKLTGGIELGRTYLFYGQEDILERVLYSLAIRGLLKYNRHVLILTLRDYHQGRIIDTYDLGYTAIQYGLDPEYALKNIFIVPIFNRRQSVNIEEIIRFIKLYGIKIILVWATTDLYRYEDYQILIGFLGKLKESIIHNPAVILFSKVSKLSKKRPPKPDGPHYLRHFANIIVYFESSRRDKRLVKMILVKHPSRSIRQGYALLDYHGLVDLYGQDYKQF